LPYGSPRSGSAAVFGEEGIDELPGPEGPEIVDVLADTDVPQGYVELLGDPDDYAPLRRSVEFGTIYRLLFFCLLKFFYINYPL